MKDDRKQQIPQDYESLSHYFNKPRQTNYDNEVYEEMIDDIHDPTGTQIW